MLKSKAALGLFLVSAALPAFAPLAAAPVARPSAEIPARPHYQPGTPLELIPVYSLEAKSPEALRSLDAEIERLYQYATTLESGPESRAFRTRIYLLEKKLRPLAATFDPAAWTALRDAVKAEWIGVQAALAATPSSAAATPAS